MKEMPIEYNEIEYVVSKIVEEKAPYEFQKIQMVLRKLYKSSDELWMDFPEYFKEYQIEALNAIELLEKKLEE